MHQGFLMENRLKRRHEQPFHVLVQLLEAKRLKLKRPLYIPLDIVYNILLRLPVKTLGRFCCVSKPWRSIISAPNFHTDHISLSQQRPLLLVINWNDTLVHFTTFSSEGSRLREFSSDRIPKYPLPGIEYPPRFRIIQSCLGLVCLKVGGDASIQFCNPSTEKIAILPYSLALEQGYEICVGFGYAASTEEFKVVRFYTPMPNDEEMYYDEEIHCEVFPLGSSSGGWREARSPSFMRLLGSRVPLLHGAVHIMPTWYPRSEEDPYIAAFDLDTEEYRGIALPEIYFREAWELACHQLAVLRESLYLVLDLVETKKTTLEGV